MPDKRKLIWHPPFLRGFFPVKLHGNQFSDSGEMNITKEDISPEYYLRSPYKNVGA